MMENYTFVKPLLCSRYWSVGIEKIFMAMLQLPHVQEKSSVCVEVLRGLIIAHEIASWFLIRDFKRKRTEVSINGDITALCF